jgi:hypothetical protein
VSGVRRYARSYRGAPWHKQMWFTRAMPALTLIGLIAEWRRQRRMMREGF